MDNILVPKGRRRAGSKVQGELFMFPSLNGKREEEEIFLLPQERERKKNILIPRKGRERGSIPASTEGERKRKDSRFQKEEKVFLSPRRERRRGNMPALKERRKGNIPTLK